MNKKTPNISIHMKVVIFYLFITLLWFSRILPYINKSMPELGIRYAGIYITEKGSERLKNFELPFHFPNIYYPTGFFTISGFLCKFIFSALGLIFKPIFVQNLTIMLSFFLSAWGMFLLIFHLTKNGIVSIIVGLYYSFTPFHIANMNVFTIFTIEWFPFAILWTLKSIKKSSWKNSLLASIFIFLTSVTSWYYTVFIILILLLVFTFHLNHLKRTLYSALKIGLITLPLICPFLLFTLRYKTSLQAGGFKYFVSGSADLLSFFIPSKNHLLFSPFFERLYSNFIANPTLNSNYITYSAILLSLIGYFKTRGVYRIIFLCLSLISFILSLGPFLQVGGLHASFNLKMPYFWLHTIPPFSFTRGIGRYALLVIIGISILMSYGMKYLIENKKYLFYLLSGTLIIEILPSLPSPKFPEPLPSFYLRLEKEKGDFSILELPLRPNGYIILYYNAFHNKKVMGGAGDRSHFIFTEKVAEKYPFLRQLRYINAKYTLPHYYQDIIKFDLKNASAAVSNVFKIKYIVIHKHDTHTLSFGHYLEEEPKIEDLLSLVKKAGWILVGEDAYIYVFKRPQTVPSPLLWIGKEWSHVQLHAGKEPVRWTKWKGGFGIYSPSTQRAIFSLYIKTSHASTAKFYLNGKEVYTYYVKGNMSRVTFPISLKEGKNEMILAGNKNSWYGVKDVEVRILDPSPF